MVLTRDPDVVRHVVLLGLMGSGKSTIGPKLAEDLGWTFRDSDADIESRHGATVRELRDRIGVDPMHELEAQQLLDALASASPNVVAAAASVIDVAACRDALKTAGVLPVWLRVDPDVLAKRFASAAHRPAYGDDPKQFLTAQAKRRDPLYASVDPFVVSMDGRTTAEVVAGVIAEVQRRGGGWAGASPVAGTVRSPEMNAVRHVTSAQPVSLRDVQSSAPALVRAAALLDLLAQPGVGALGLSDLARRLDLPKSTVANLCRALEQVAFVRRVESRYELGPHVLELGAAYTAKNDIISEFRKATRGLRWASEETIQLATLEGAQVLYLARHDGTQPIRLAAGIGRRMPAPCTGLGKAMLAQLDTDEVAARVSTLPAFPVLTPRSLRNLAELLDDLDRVRERGYAIDDEENSVGVVCYAVPLPHVGPGGPQRAISVTLLKARETDELRDRLVDDLHELADRLSRLL
jgi:IclR family transcriptional regulator, blcABC operon repressor